MFGGIVLAAGASTRLGQPKGLLSVQGEPAVSRCARLLGEAGCDDVVVVVGADAERVARAVPAASGRVVTHAAWSQGQTTSVQAALRALDASCCFLVWPVDRPAVRLETVRAILRAEEGAIRVPTQGGRRGHPVHFDASLRTEILSLGSTDPLHEVVRREPQRVHEVPVDDPGVLLNVDTPQDVDRLERLLGGGAPARPVA